MLRICKTVAAGVLLVLAVGTGAMGTEAASATPSKTRKSAAKRTTPPVSLVWHVEAVNGESVTSLDADLPINPASVVKVATTLWALDRLGPDHRFDTKFEAAGVFDEKKGVLRGDLLVRGGGDPDFHVENAFLVAARLNQLGIRQITGALRVDERFWIGWEGGSDRVIKVTEQRSVLMATRLRAALDPKRWNGTTRAAWKAFAGRYSLPATQPPGVSVLGGAGATRKEPGEGRLIFTHRSNPLLDTLRRFDAFSNNDIERLGDSLGSPADMAGHLALALEAPSDSVRLETISGLGVNRMTPRMVVKMLRMLRARCEELGLSIESVLPVAGCDPGTLNQSFARLCNGPNRMCMVAKTGTLTYTDGGAAVLAGFIKTARGDLAFCVAAPNASGRVNTARRQQADWIERLIAESGGPRLRNCAPPLARPEQDAKILLPPAGGLAGGGTATR